MLLQVLEFYLHITRRLIDAKAYNFQPIMTFCRYTGDPRTGWNLPPANSSKYPAYLMGIKIACGLEMLVARAHEEQRKRRAARTDTSSTSQDDAGVVVNEEAWRAFLKRLEASGYFRELLEGSQEREQLVQTARTYYEQHVSLSEAGRRSDGCEAERLLKLYRDIQSNDVEMDGKEEGWLIPRSLLLISVAYGLCCLRVA